MNSGLILPLLLVLFAGFMFMTARRQRRQAQDTQQMQSSLVPGDRVMTTSGLYGTVVDTDTDTDDDTIEIEVAPGVHTTWVRQAVREKIKPEIESDEDTDDVVDDKVEDGPKADGR